MPEDDFQTGNYVKMPCLSEPAQSLDPAQRSPFTELIALESIIRNLSMHRQRSSPAAAEPGHAATQSFWNRHKRLDEMVKARVGLLLQKYPISQCQSDPVLLFTIMMLHAVVLCLCEIMESAHSESQQDDSNTVRAFRHRSLQVTSTILSLSRSLTQLSCLKVCATHVS